MFRWTAPRLMLNFLLRFVGDRVSFEKLHRAQMIRRRGRGTCAILKERGEVSEEVRNVEMEDRCAGEPQETLEGLYIMLENL